MALWVATILFVAVVAYAVSVSGVPAVLIAERHPTPEGRALVERFVLRSRRFRTGGALVGLVVALVLAACAAAERRNPDVIIDVDILATATIAFGGAVVGAIAAEAFRLRRPSGPRSAALSVREPVHYADGVADRREQVLLTGCGVTLVVGIVLGGFSAASVGFGVLMALVAVCRRAAVRRIALRPRPALRPALADADDDVRRLAASYGLSRPALILEALLGYQACVSMVRNGAPILAVGAAAFAIHAVGWWWEARSFGLADRQAAQ
jgi:hypothetical protein